MKYSANEEIFCFQSEYVIKSLLYLFSELPEQGKYVSVDAFREINTRWLKWRTFIKKKVIDPITSWWKKRNCFTCHDQIVFVILYSISSK